MLAQGHKILFLYVDGQGYIGFWTDADAYTDTDRESEADARRRTVRMHWSLEELARGRGGRLYS